jgi:two-component system, sensor histidine kinase and response regulator
MKNEEYNILVVDDNQDNRQILATRLKRRGYNVDMAEDGHVALQKVDDQRFDLVILDIMMPGIDGFEVLTSLRKTYSLAELPIIMATAKDDSTDVVNALKLGANDYVTKPIDFPVLIARVQTALSLKSLSRLKDEFLRIASHDLKNPLWSVMTSAQMLQEMYTSGETIDENGSRMLSIIYRHTRTMQRIIEDFLDFQAVEDGQLSLTKKPVDLNALAGQLVELLKENADKKGIPLALELAPGLPSVPADEARIGQIIENFIGNAIKFTPKQGGPTTIKTSMQADIVLVEIQDSGPGLKEEEMSQAFVKYSRLTSKPTGGEKSSGLGLSICKQLVELHGGQVGVRNNPSGGATFWFTLPVN